jgi:hypothetical protein
MALLAEHRVVLDASAEEVYRHLTTVQGILRWMAVDELASPDFLVYVTCFCESTDLLSQWRAYGSDHGYAIEFSANSPSEKLRRCFDRMSSERRDPAPYPDFSPSLSVSSPVHRHA